METPKGTIPAMPYLEERLAITIGIKSYDFTTIQSLECWRRAFPNNRVDWTEGWKMLWRSASLFLGSGTDFMDGRVALDLQAYFEDGGLASVGVAYPCEFEDSSYWEPRAIDLLDRACGTDIPVAGCVGIVVDEGDDRSRPCLTMMVSGPGGAEEAARIILQALADHGLTAGIAIRTVRSNTAGVVKVTFLPELYLYVGHSSFGINWPQWSNFAAGDPVIEWCRVALYWCDRVIAAVEKVQEVAALMVDSTYFDFMRVVPIGSQNLKTRFDLTKPNLAELMEVYPYQFLFGLQPG